MRKIELIFQVNKLLGLSQTENVKKVNIKTLEGDSQQNLGDTVSGNTNCNTSAADKNNHLDQCILVSTCQKLSKRKTFCFIKCLMYNKETRTHCKL